ncbi:MAG: amidase domain-containing protein [Oscillospiraceae bacterium]|nr:amidase domain-containing protein [Oscillospiraceae bacterium]
MEYDRAAAVRYARRWAFRRNPAYYNFDDIGGDCTNFVSQCVYAGAGVMNYTPAYGWYYISPDNRAPAWTGVQFFYNFMTANQGAGPYGYDAPLSEALPGDIIQLAYNNSASFTHTLLVVGVSINRNPRNILLAAHTNDAYRRRLSSYSYTNIRLIHILGVNEQ